MKADIIILARGGSKGIPRKNMQMLGGQTLIARAVKTCLKAETCRAVYVSTDDDEIADSAAGEGAWTIERPPELASDTATSEAALEHAVAQLPRRPVFVAMVQCTTPFLTPEDIDGCVDALDHYYSAVSVVPFHGVLLDGRIGYRDRRQDMPPRYQESGGVYAMQWDEYDRAAAGRYCGAPPEPIEAKYPHHLEIDTPHDLEMARALCK